MTPDEYCSAKAAQSGSSFYYSFRLLPDAKRRADSARYQEIEVRSALAESQGMPFRWALNPYRGCTHACEYCYARKYQRYLELGSGDEFSSVIFVKTNLPEALARQLTSVREAASIENSRPVRLQSRVSTR